MSSTAIAASAAAIAATAENEARTARCQQLVSTFVNQTATSAERLDFAGCVQFLQPTTLSSEMEFAIKIAILLIFAGGFWSLIKERDRCYDFADYIAAYVFGMLATAGALIGLAILGAMIGFLFR